MGAESEFEYGSRSGSWRILRLFKEQGYKFTTWAVSQAMSVNPTFARALVRDGHEIAAHGAR
jgi:peptidoglycan/xylan/chitin deacetylase (PgdA/CDA1 family)